MGMRLTLTAGAELRDSEKLILLLWKRNDFERSGKWSYRRSDGRLACDVVYDAAVGKMRIGRS
jgi:hypothetical protein